MRLPGFDGELLSDEDSRASAADDFGHLVHRIPTAVLRPGSTADVAKMVRWAGERGDALAPRGAGHSVWGRSQVADGVVVDMSTLRAVHAVGRDRLRVDAGATWRDVLAATLPRGLAPPVLVDYLDLSVGGTVVVGGVGERSLTSGLLSDHLLTLEVVTGAGEEVTCSATRHADLFNAVRGGLGQVAIITRVTLVLRAAPRAVRQLRLYYPSLAAMLDEERRLAGDSRFDAVQGAIIPAARGGWTYRIDATAYVVDAAPDDDALLAGLGDDAVERRAATMPYAVHVDRLSALESALRASGQWSGPHPWLMTFLGDSTVERTVDGELDRLDPPADLGLLGQVVLSPIRRAAVTTPLMRLPPDPLCYAFNFVRLPTNNEDAARRLVAANRAIYQRVRAAGGTLYPVSAVPMSDEDWSGHFGGAYDRLVAAKRAYDPLGILTPGYEVLRGDFGTSARLPHRRVAQRRPGRGRSGAT
jgi:FAD/FMN-containing dehydrogenase